LLRLRRKKKTHELSKKGNAMPMVWIPALLRDLTGGTAQVSVTAETVGEAVERLEERYPGVKERLVEGERLRPNIAVIVDGVTGQRRLREKVGEDSEIHFIASISGG
jgi:molybdopterin converting factor small subunit